MANTVETFRGISALIFKWLFFALVGIVAIALAVIGIASAYTYITHDRHAAKVEVVVMAYKEKGKPCVDTPEYPLFVGIVNNSSKTVEQVSFSLEARRKGYSTDLATYENYTEDRIRKPGEGWGSCWRAPLKTDVKDDPRDLEWKAKYVRITFE